MSDKMKKVVENIPKKKVGTVRELAELIKTKRTVLVADISGIPGSQFQQIGKKLRSDAVVKVPKKNLLFRAIDEAKNEKLKELKEKIQGPVAILFSDLDSYKLAAKLLKNKSPAKAKAGQTSPKELEIPAGPTDLVPGPAISELGSVGIQIQIQGGKIEIKEPKVVAKAGDVISQKVADILGKLNIMPFTIGFTPLVAYDKNDNLIYTEIKIDTEAARTSLLGSYSQALSFAVSIGFVNNETIKIMISRAAAHERRINRIISGEPEEIQIVEEKKEETQPEEKKEEAKTDGGAGLASLFG